MNKKYMLLIGLIAAALLFSFWIMQTPQHSMPQAGKIEQGASIVDVTLPAALSKNAKTGETIYNVKCAACHGSNAAGKNGMGPPLIHKIYEPGHHGDFAFLSAARNGVQSHHWPFGNMPVITGLTDEDIKSIVFYIREVQRENGIN